MVRLVTTIENVDFNPMHRRTFPFLALLLIHIEFGYGQGLLLPDPLGAGNGIVSLQETKGVASRYYLGTELLPHIPLFQKIATSTTSLMAQVGISDRIDLQVQAQYIHIQGQADRRLIDSTPYENQLSGFQDVDIGVRIRLHRFTFSNITLGVSSNHSFTLPITDYTQGADLQSILAIGNGATGIRNGVDILLKSKKGLFGTASTHVEHWSQQIPNQLVAGMSTGYFHPDVLLMFFLTNHSSLSGVDGFSEDFDGNFLLTRVRRSLLGVQLLKPVGSGWGIQVIADTVIAGRNTPKSSSFTLGITYNLGSNQPFNTY